jgi:hypothetical protein
MAGGNLDSAGVAIIAVAAGAKGNRDLAVGKDEVNQRTVTTAGPARAL